MLKNMQTNISLVDYAHPCMMAETALKKLHHAMLDGDYDTALEQALIAITETRLTFQAIRHEKEKQVQA